MTPREQTLFGILVFVVGAIVGLACERLQRDNFMKPPEAPASAPLVRLSPPPRTPLVASDFRYTTTSRAYIGYKRLFYGNQGKNCDETCYDWPMHIHPAVSDITSRCPEQAIAFEFPPNSTAVLVVDGKDTVVNAVLLIGHARDAYGWHAEGIALMDTNTYAEALLGGERFNKPNLSNVDRCWCTQSIKLRQSDYWELHPLPPPDADMHAHLPDGRDIADVRFMATFE